MQQANFDSIRKDR